MKLEILWEEENQKKKSVSYIEIRYLKYIIFEKYEKYLRKKNHIIIFNHIFVAITFNVLKNISKINTYKLEFLQYNFFIAFRFYFFLLVFYSHNILQKQKVI